MKVIQPNCRIQFTPEDIRFITTVLGQKSGGAESVLKLLGDDDTRDLILDNETLFHTLLEHRGCIAVSSHFYFYILVRNVLRRSGIDDRSVADYVAELLAEYSRIDRTECRVPGQAGALEYFFEMLTALQTADDRTSFFIRAHIGNHSLFLSGVFLSRIRHRAESRGFPDVRYYESLGQMNFRLASDHRLAAKYDLAPIYATLSERFRTARRALNDMADRLVSLGDFDRGIDGVLQSAMQHAE